MAPKLRVQYANINAEYGFPVGATGSVVMPMQVGIPQLEVYDFMSVVVNGIVDIRNRGADPTGVADSTDAINAAVEEAKTDEKLLVGYGGTYRVDGTVNLKTSCDFRGAEFQGADGVEVPVIRIADDDVLYKRLQSLIMYLPRVTRTEANRPVSGGDTTWPYDNDGIRIEGLSRSFVVFDRVENHRNGIHILSCTDTVCGTDFNQFFLTHVNANQTNLWLDWTPRPSHPTDLIGGNNLDGGWINENRFYGGCLRHEGVSINDTSYGIAGCSQMKVTGFWNVTALGYPENNTFHNLSLEGNAHEYSIICSGNDNEWHNCRLERFTPFPPERVLLTRPVMDIDNPERFANRNVFRGRAFDRLYDTGNSYGSFYSTNWTGQKNYVQDVNLIGHVADLGAGTVLCPQS